MEPNIPGIGVYFRLQQSDSLPFSGPHLFDFLVEKACYGHPEQIKIDYDLIHDLLLVLSFYDVAALFQHVDSLVQPLQGFFFSQESRDVEHAGALAFADQRQAESIHDVT